MMSQTLPKSFSNLFETVLFQTDDQVDIEELREYYADFFNPEAFVKTEITHSKIIQGIGEKYTVGLMISL